MATYYADFDLTTGNNDGTTAANAWQTMQRAVDGTGGTQPTANDIVYCKGTDTLAANLDLDGLSGDGANGLVKWIGVSSLDPVTNDGTRATLDGVDTYTCTATTIDYWSMENFEFTQMAGDGFTGVSSPRYWFFDNCSFNNNSSAGLNPGDMTGTFFVRCTFYANGTDGIASSGQNITFIFCSMHDNTGDGLFSSYRQYIHFIGCLIYDNGDDGIGSIGVGIKFFNCTINGNTSHGMRIENLALLIGNRITNQSGTGKYGIYNYAGRVFISGWNYFEDNDTHIEDASHQIEILDAGVGTDDEDNADTNEGYTSKTDGAEDFSLNDSASLRRTAITVPIV